MSYLITLALDFKGDDSLKQEIFALLEKREFKRHPKVAGIWLTTSPKASFTGKLVKTFSEPLGWDKPGIESRWRYFISQLHFAKDQPIEVHTFMQIGNFGWVSTNLSGTIDDLKIDINCEPLLPQD